MNLTINGIEATLKKESSFEYVSENRLFTDADDYSLEIELPLNGCPNNQKIFGNIYRKDVDIASLYYDAILQDGNFTKAGAIVITGVTQSEVKVQFLERRSFRNFYPKWDETYVDELDLGEWPKHQAGHAHERQQQARVGHIVGGR